MRLRHNSKRRRREPCCTQRSSRTADGHSRRPRPTRCFSGNIIRPSFRRQRFGDGFACSGMAHRLLKKMCRSCRLVLRPTAIETRPNRQTRSRSLLHSRRLSTDENGFSKLSEFKYSGRVAHRNMPPSGMKIFTSGGKCCLMQSNIKSRLDL